MTFLICLSVPKVSHLAGGLQGSMEWATRSYNCNAQENLTPYIPRKPIYWLWCDYWHVNSTNDCFLQRGVRFVWVLSMSDIAFCCYPQGLFAASRSEFYRSFSVRNVLCVGWLVNVCSDMWTLCVSADIFLISNHITEILWI